MFQKPITDSKIPPNFLNSILSNNALYDMFKNEFAENSEYFRGIGKEEYLYAMEEFICSKLLSGNLFQIYNETDIENKVKNSEVLNFIERFYNDFMAPKIDASHREVFLTKFFKALEFAKEKDLYTKASDDFARIYSKIMANYDNYKDELLDDLRVKLNSDNLTVADFDYLCEYTKNNIWGSLPIDLVTIMIKNHAYKINHIFDKEVVKVLVFSIANDYLGRFNLSINIEYREGIRISKEESEYEFETNTIYIDGLLLDTFISGNYVELICELFYKMDMFKNNYLILSKNFDMPTFRAIMNLVNLKVDMKRIFIDSKYKPYNYMIDLKGASFVKTLKFYQTLGVDLFSNFINSTLKNIDIKRTVSTNYSKEIASEILFLGRIQSLDNEKRVKLFTNYKVLNLFYEPNGTRKKAITLIKRLSVSSHRKLIIEYLRTTIPYPELLIRDVLDLADFKSSVAYINEFIDGLLTYIYVDTFYYSLDSLLLVQKGKENFDRASYLNEIENLILEIIETDRTKRFKKYALKHIEETKQTAT